MTLRRWLTTLVIGAGVVGCHPHRVTWQPSYGIVRPHGVTGHTVALKEFDMLIVRGNGDTNLLCYLYDKDSWTADRDLRNGPSCSLFAPATGVYHLVVRNQGKALNEYTFRVEHHTK